VRLEDEEVLAGDRRDPLPAGEQELEQRQREGLLQRWGIKSRGTRRRACGVCVKGVQPEV
jgi:hypothetical protein